MGELPKQEINTQQTRYSKGIEHTGLDNFRREVCIGGGEGDQSPSIFTYLCIVSHFQLALTMLVI